MQPTNVLRRTLKGMNHQSTMLLRVIHSPSSVKIRHGRKRANTSLLRRRKVDRGMTSVFGWARMRPIRVMEMSFIKGMKPLSKSAASLLMARSWDMIRNTVLQLQQERLNINQFERIMND